nr:hypothetical protein [Eubacterium sp.]
IGLEITNKSGVFFESLKCSYTLYDQLGNVIKSETDGVYVSSLISGKKIHFVLTYTGAQKVGNVKLSKKAKTSRSVQKKYTNQSKKVTASFNKTTKEIKLKNKTKKAVSGYAEVDCYNAAGELIYVNQVGINLTSKGVNTQSVDIPNDTAKTKVTVRAYSEKYVGW